MDKGFMSLLRQVRQLFSLYSKRLTANKKTPAVHVIHALKKYIGKIIEVVAVNPENRMKSRFFAATTQCDKLSRRKQS